MTTKKQATETRVLDSQRKPETTVAERKIVETAKPTNAVSAKDAFGAPKNDPAWTREAIAITSRKPSFEGSGDNLTDELAEQHKK